MVCRPANTRTSLPDLSSTTPKYGAVRSVLPSRATAPCLSRKTATERSGGLATNCLAGSKAAALTIANRSFSKVGILTDIWARKSVVELLAEAAQAGVDAEVRPLRRTLSAPNLVALGVGGIIGAGIFVLTGHAAAANAGPAVTLSFLLGAIACAFAGLCYAEMASTVPISGSAYTYAYATLGELMAWIIGWDLILEYAVGAVTVAIGWSGYVVSFARDFGLDLPSRLVSSPLSFDDKTHAWSSTGAIFNVPAMLIIVLVTALLVVGIRESA